jgi:hydrogenase maturation factor
MQKTAEEAGVKIVCGDTKVVEKGSADQIFTPFEKQRTNHKTVCR